MLASHNTFSYRKPIKWFLRPIAFIGKCQSKSYMEQYNAGVRSFDIRIRFEKQQLVFAHGIFSYDASDIDTFLSYCNALNLRVRVMYENRLSKQTDDDLNRFINYCKEIETTYPNIEFYGGRNMKTWAVIYNFKHQVQEKDYYSSTTALIKPLPKIDDFFPWLYATIKRDTYMAEFQQTPNEVSFLIDFV